MSYSGLDATVMYRDLVRLDHWTTFWKTRVLKILGRDEIGNGNE